MNDPHRTLELPSGRTATIRRGKGRDLIRAHRAVADGSEPMSLSLALIAELTQIDGRQLVYEDLLEMDLDDVLALEALVEGGADGPRNFSAAAPARQDIGFPAPEPSSNSSASGSR